MVSYLLYLTASVAVRFLPTVIAEQIAKIIAFLFYIFRPEIRQNVKRNFGALNIRDMRTYAVFKNFSKTITDFLKLDPERREELQRRCRIHGMTHLNRVLKGGKGAILITPHLGPWEIAGARLASLGYRVHTVALEHPSPQVTKFFSSKRASWGIQDYPLGESVSKLLQALRDGEVVVLLIDRRFSTRGVPLRFLGRDIPLPDGHIVLSMRTGSPLLPCWCYYTDDGSIEGYIEEPVELGGEEIPPGEIGARCLQRIEKYIRAHPEQWFAFDHLWPEDRRV